MCAASSYNVGCLFTFYRVCSHQKDPFRRWTMPFIWSVTCHAAKLSEKDEKRSSVSDKHLIKVRYVLKYKKIYELCFYFKFPKYFSWYRKMTCRSMASELNDSFGRPPWNFNSNNMLKKISPLARLRNFCITRKADVGPNVDKAPRPSISNFIWVLSSDTICQLNQFNTNSEAAMLSRQSGLCARSIWQHDTSFQYKNINSLESQTQKRKGHWRKKYWGEKETLASKYRAAKAGHISAKGNGGKITGEKRKHLPPNSGQQKLDT